VRLSLGAGRRRIFGQLLTEGFLLSILGGGMGLALSAAALGPFLSLLPPDTPRLTEVSLDGSVLVFSLGLSVVTGILMSLAPGLAASGTDLSSALKAAVRGTTGGRRRNRTQATLLVAEIALTFVLLVGAGLLTRSFTRLTSVDPGFSSDGAIVLRIDMRGSRYEERERMRQAYDELCRRLEALPGVTSVALATPGPFGSWFSNGTTVDTREGPVRTNVEEEDVSSNYFETMRVPLVAGRTFTPDEVEIQAPVVMVNAALAETFWAGEDPIGQRVNPHGEWLTVVGVVGNVRRRLDREPFPTLFNPNAYDRPAVIIKAAGDPAGILAGAREALRAVDPDVPVISLSTLDATINGTLAGPRVRSLLVGAFSVFAALLAVLGLFGLLAYAVTQQTKEIGIRMALGAEGGVVMREVLVRGIALLAVGLALGFLVTLVAARAVEPFLFQVGKADPATFATVALLLSGASLAASVVPARRAMRVDPVDALKAEP
jgi:putative ABC transport system permease protein